jgi:uracil permease
MAKDFIDVHETPPIQKMIPLSLQHLFAMFGATVLVPLITGLDVQAALLSSGLGTLLFIFLTKGLVPNSLSLIHFSHEFSLIRRNSSTRN